MSDPCKEAATLDKSPPSTQVEFQVGKQQLLLDTLSTAVSNLNDRLVTIMVPGPPPLDAIAQDDTLVELAGRLSDSNNKIIYLADLLNDMLNRIEL